MNADRLRFVEVSTTMRAHLVGPHKTDPCKIFYLFYPFCYGREIVPQLVICHKCGAVLYEGEELKTPSDIIESYDDKCPNCNKKLSYIPIDAEVKPVDETNQLSPFEPEKTRPSRKKKRPTLRKSRNETKKLERKTEFLWLTP